MNTKLTTSIVAFAALVWASALPAHHSLGRYDLSAPIWLAAVVVRFERINPHAVVVVDQDTGDGHVQRWTVTGPDVRQLDRMGIDQEFLQAGDVVQFCGFALKDSEASQRPAPPPGGVSDKLMNGHLLVLPDGHKQFWSDYGQLHQCVDADELEAVRSTARGVTQDP